MTANGMFDPPHAGNGSAELVRQIAEHAPGVMIVTTALDFRIVFANQAAHRAVAAAPPDLVGQAAAEVLPFVDPAHGVSTPQGRPLRACCGRFVGCNPMVGSFASCVGDGPNEDGLVLVTAVDVTHHELAQARAQASHDTLEALLSCIPEGISIAHGSEIHVERVSARGLSLLGRNAEEVTGRSALRETDVWEVYRPDCDIPLAPADRPLARATRTGEIVLHETLLVRHADGSLLTLVCNSGPIRDAAGQVTGAIMTWQDVTELHRAQAALRDSDERLRAVLLQIPAAIFIVEAPDGRVAFKSRLVDELLGDPESDPATARATLRGWAFHADGTPYELSEYPSRRALYQGETVRAEPMSYRRGDGRLIDLEMHAGPVHGKTGEVIAAVAVALDVTERHVAEARQAFYSSCRTHCAP